MIYMQSLILSFESVMPIFLMMLLGYVLKCLGAADKKTFDAINRLVFKVFLPVLLFNNIYSTKSTGIFDGKLVAFAAAGILLVFALGYGAVLLLCRDNAKRGAMLQGIFRSNFAILGVPLVDYVCRGESSGLASLMVAIVVPLYNVLAVITLERFRSGKPSFAKLGKGIVTNPLIIGCGAGLLFLLSAIRLPALLENTIDDIGAIASPLALIVLGASFTFSSIKGYVKELAIVVSTRLVIVPLMMLSLAAACGFRDEALACLLVVFGSPVAVSSFAMAQQMGADEKLAAQAVVITSALCIVTLFVWIFVLSFLGFI